MCAKLCASLLHLCITPYFDHKLPLTTFYAHYRSIVCIYLWPLSYIVQMYIQPSLMYILDSQFVADMRIVTDKDLRDE